MYFLPQNLEFFRHLITQLRLKMCMKIHISLEFLLIKIIMVIKRYKKCLNMALLRILYSEKKCVFHRVHQARVVCFLQLCTIRLFYTMFFRNPSAVFRLR